MYMERNLSIVPYNSAFGASSSSSKVKMEDDEEEEEEDMSMSLTQWLNPTKLPSSYLDLLNEEPKSSDEKASSDYVVKKIVLPSRRDAGGGIRTLYSASERDRISVKPSIRVQSRTNNYEICGSSSKVKIPVGKRLSRNKSQRPMGQFYTEKLRSWKERSYNSNNRDFSPVYGKYRDVPSKKFNYNRNKNGSYGNEQKRKQKIEGNIKALGYLLPHETEDAPELILDDVIAHVKLLQLQMKELSRSRLGGEAISHPMISIEGFGHYIHHEQMKTKPLEEVIADLLANDFDAAASLLETKGLYLMPLSSVQGFP